MAVPWIVKLLLVVLKTRRGRELLFAGALGALEVAQSERARKVYGRTREWATDPRRRRKAIVFARNAVARI